MYNDYSTFRAQQKSFPSTDGVIKYTDIGQGKPILLIHGIPTSSWLYRKMMKELKDKGFRVIAPDMLGFGNSESPKGYKLYSQAEHSKRILELMQFLGIEKWSHVLHDAGGLWTWELCKTASHKIENLVILNTIIYEEGFKPPMRMQPGNIAKISMWAYRNKITTNVLLKNLFSMGLNENNLTKAELEGYKTPLTEGKTRAMYYFFTQTCNEFQNYDSVFAELKMPIKVIWGINDKMLQLAPQQTKIINGLRLKGADIHIFIATHFIQEEKPLEINKVIQELINGN